MMRISGIIPLGFVVPGRILRATFFVCFCVGRVIDFEMTQRFDAELLERYAEHKSDAAFAEIVERHVDLVFGTALRLVGRV